jgi:hypothetical protein
MSRAKTNAGGVLADVKDGIMRHSVFLARYGVGAYLLILEPSAARRTFDLDANTQ